MAPGRAAPGRAPAPGWMTGRFSVGSRHTARLFGALPFFPAGGSSAAGGSTGESRACGAFVFGNGLPDFLFHFVDAVSQLRGTFEIKLFGGLQHVAFQFADEFLRDEQGLCGNSRESQVHGT